MSLLQSARAIAHTLLQVHQGQITDEVLLSVIEKASAINIVEGQTFDKQELFEILRADFSIGKGEITILSEDIEPWLNDEKANINFELWNRYKLFMSENDPSFPINDLDDFTDKILDKCVNPKKDGSWDRRGMVVGHVQSGKTSNYVGLVNKATDAGYKVIIIIAGTISSLRRQTQERIDSGYIGRNSSAFIRENENRVIGVGKYKTNTDIYSLTSSYYKSGDEGDFNQKIATRLNIPIGKNPVVFVIKKNKSILENLIDWFSKDVNAKLIDGTPKLFDVPALIIDDEADSASVNASRDINEIKTINRLIRTLLNIFNQNTFVGYTATPYANLFISQDHNEELTTIVKGKQYKIGEDLFPRDFIINIKAPTNYIGAAKIFGYENSKPELTKEPLDIFREISDYDPPFFRTINRENKDILPEYLPPSLERAIKSFILTCAIRRVRGHENKHNSMLIHVALLVRWIDKVAYLVNEKTKEYQDAIQSEDDTLLKELKEIYETDFLPTTRNVLENLDYTDIRIKEHNWEVVKKELKPAALKIDVRSVHGTRSTTNLEYHNIQEIDYSRYEKEGKSLYVIAVGGSRLSRGITLEGLSVSYYIRTTRMYDSLMQMGRWFGYRPGYVDLCRLYTTNQIFEWFNHITMATEEMRNDFDEMTATHQRPKDFRLKVRNHHGLLTITSLNKLYFSEDIEISFSGENPQTYCLLKTKNAIENNFFALKSLINSIGFPSIENRKVLKGKIRHLLYRNVNLEALCSFIDTYKINQPSINNSTLSEYIIKQSKGTRIKEWNICIVGNTDEMVFIDYNGNTPPKERKPIDKISSYILEYEGEKIKMNCSVRNQLLKNRNSENFLISKNQIDQTGDRQVDLEVQNKEYSKIKERRSIEKKGLLLIYALDERGTFFEEKYGLPIIGYSIHFPKIEDEEKVSYKVSKKYLDFEEEIMEDDDNPETENS
ncbi:Z1 domain-containing protein [Halpernia humi]|uniref:Z1 domain-containing protein n=1 Tax=Halpernia humi TaxID=493375 RepID=A0A1H5YCU9_9FLAO|nr:Z1 domain-containing protein [Halpernia humi]SEG21447.1 Z1 domain-containing protein [Halpernia humi]